MARPRKPTKILELNGALKVNPGRHANRANEPEVTTPILPAPSDFDDDQRRAWNELTAQAPQGVLTSADTVAVEMAAYMLSDFRKARREGGVFTPSQFAQLGRLLSQFGMTPADRSKLNIAPPKAVNPFARFG